MKARRHDGDELLKFKPSNRMGKKGDQSDSEHGGSQNRIEQNSPFFLLYMYNQIVGGPYQCAGIKYKQKDSRNKQQMQEIYTGRRIMYKQEGYIQKKQTAHNRKGTHQGTGCIGPGWIGLPC